MMFESFCKKMQNHGPTDTVEQTLNIDLQRGELPKNVPKSVLPGLSAEFRFGLHQIRSAHGTLSSGRDLARS